MNMDPEPLPAPQQPPKSRWWLAALTVMLVAGVWWMQRPEGEDAAAAKKARTGLNVKAPKSDPLILLGKVMLAVEQEPALAPFHDAVRVQIDGPEGLVGDDPASHLRAAMLLLADGATDEPSAQPAVPFVGARKDLSISDHLDKVEEAVDPESPLLDDVKALRTILDAAETVVDSDAQDQRRAKVAAAVASLVPEQIDGLKIRHGWFADILAAAGDAKAPVRVRAEEQGALFLGGFMLLGCFILLALLTGLVLLIIGIVLLAQGRLKRHFARPPPLGQEEPHWAEHIWLETMCVFAGGFLALKLVMAILDRCGVSHSVLLVSSLAGNWLLAAAIFWPIIRGLDWRTWRQRLGWRTNRPGAAGVLREIGCGILGYLSTLPILIFVAFVLFFVVAIYEAMTGHKPTSPRQLTKVEELVGSGSVWLTVVVFMLAVIWAPIVEESIFRGALFRHLRRRWSVLGSALLSAAAFAAMHPYILLQMVLIGVLGLTFALMREWRGSLIPSATAHFIQNSFALSVMLAVSPLMKP
jgi:membrane protease YdiL (CAAX protease family)